MDLKGKVAIVTGAGRGIGRQTALDLARAGAKVVTCAVTKHSIDKVKGEIKEMGREVLGIQMDVSKWEDAEKMSRRVMERFGHIDILVNNAGISPKGKGGARLGVLEIEESIWDSVMNVNLKGVFNCTKAVVPFMISQRSGRIVNIGSTTGLTGDISSAPYCASKAGIMALTKVFAREFGKYNIIVNSVAPGLVLTDMQADTPPERIEQLRRGTALGKAGEPEDIARVILFLVSEGIHVTGQTIIVDGGKTMY